MEAKAHKKVLAFLFYNAKNKPNPSLQKNLINMNI